MDLILKGLFIYINFVQTIFLPFFTPKTVYPAECPVGAIQPEGSPVVDQTKCIGCGACAMGCEVVAIRMVRRPEEEIARLDAEVDQGRKR